MYVLYCAHYVTAKHVGLELLHAALGPIHVVLTCHTPVLRLPDNSRFIQGSGPYLSNQSVFVRSSHSLPSLNIAFKHGFSLEQMGNLGGISR